MKKTKTKTEYCKRPKLLNSNVISIYRHKNGNLFFYKNNEKCQSFNSNNKPEYTGLLVNVWFT